MISERDIQDWHNKPTRFDLEQDILKTWNICDDIKMLYQQSKVMEMSQDEIRDVLLSMYTLYQMKFDQMFSTFEKLLAQKKI